MSAFSDFELGKELELYGDLSALDDADEFNQRSKLEHELRKRKMMEEACRCSAPCQISSKTMNGQAWCQVSPSCPQGSWSIGLNGFYKWKPCSPFRAGGRAIYPINPHNQVRWLNKWPPLVFKRPSERRSEQRSDRRSGGNAAEACLVNVFARPISAVIPTTRLVRRV